MKQTEIFTGDCLELMKNIQDDMIDLIVTSPPYNNWRNKRTQAKKEGYWKRTNIDYEVFDDKMSDDAYFEWQLEFLNECYRVLKKTGTLVYNHKDQIFNFQVKTPLEWILKSNLVYRQRVTWDRRGMQAYNPVRFYRTEEDIYILGKCAKGFKWNSEYAKYLSIWQINPSPKTNHPAAFPIEIPKRAIESFTHKNDLVLDPFMGSGTTGIACKHLNRNFIGIELNPKYVEIAEKRIEDADSNINQSKSIEDGVFDIFD